MDRGLDLVNFTVIFGKINPICVALGLGILFQFTIVKFRMTYHELQLQVRYNRMRVIRRGIRDWI